MKIIEAYDIEEGDIIVLDDGFQRQVEVVGKWRDCVTVYAGREGFTFGHEDEITVM